MSGASEQANRRVSGPVLQSVFLAVIDHSAPRPDAHVVSKLYGQEDATHHRPIAFNKHSGTVTIYIYLFISAQKCTVHFLCPIPLEPQIMNFDS